MNTSKIIRPYLKILLSIIVIAFVVIWFIALQVKSYYHEKNFYIEKVSTYIVSANDYQGRSKEFHLANGMLLYISRREYNRFLIGDSVWKGSNTYFYEVYRLDSGRYSYNATYNFITDNL